MLKARFRTAGSWMIASGVMAAVWLANPCAWLEGGADQGWVASAHAQKRKKKKKAPVEDAPPSDSGGFTFDEGVNLGGEAPPPPAAAPPPAAVPMGPPPASSSTAAPEAPADAAAPAVLPPPAASSGGEGGGDMSFEGIRTTAGSADKDKLDAGNKAIKEDDCITGSVLMFDVLNNPNAGDFHQEAEYRLAFCLYKLKKFHSSLYYASSVIQKGGSHNFFQVALALMIKISEDVVNSDVVLTDLATFENIDPPAKFKDQLKYSLARFAYFRNDFEKAQRLILEVSKDHPLYPKARFLEAVILYRLALTNFNPDSENYSVFEPSVAALKDVVNLTNPRGGKFEDPVLRRKAYATLARVHYAAHQFRASLFYYDKIERETDEWVDSLFESAWASYRLNRHDQALGKLYTLHTPFFADVYNPETQLLESIIYYDNCRYDRAETVVNGFIDRYNPVVDQVKKINSSNRGPEDTYKFIFSKNAASSSGGVLDRIISLVLSDKELKRIYLTILEIEKERKSFDTMPSFWTGSALARKLRTDLELRRKQFTQMAGSLAQRKLKEEEQNLNSWISQAYKIRLETTTKQQEQNRAQLSGGGLEIQLRPYRFSAATPDNREYWPFDGEFWRDELGTYEITLSQGCRAQ